MASRSTIPRAPPVPHLIWPMLPVVGGLSKAAIFTYDCPIQSQLPGSIFPPERWSSMVVSRANFQGGRRGNGVTSGPNLIRSVVMVIAASAIQGSPMGKGQFTLAPMWSQRKNPSHHAASDARAYSASRRGSLESPKFGVSRAKCIEMLLFIRCSVF